MLYAARLNEPYEARLEAKHRYLKSNYSKTKLARFCYQNESEKEEKVSPERADPVNGNDSPDHGEQEQPEGQRSNEASEKAKACSDIVVLIVPAICCRPIFVLNCCRRLILRLDWHIFIHRHEK